MIKAKNQLQGQLNASIIHEYPELENVEITPAVEDRVYKSDMYGIDEVLVKGVRAYIDEDIKPEYIKEGVNILGVTGNIIELQGEEKTIVPTTTKQVIIPSEGKNAITKLSIEAVDNTIDEDIKPENIADGVNILGVVGNFKGVDTSDATATSEDILAGKTAYINNTKVEGTIEEYNGSFEGNVSEGPKITNGNYLFYNGARTDYLEDLLKLCENITNMSDMFYGCSKLTKLDLSNFNTSNATNMNSMFNGCSKLIKLDLSNFNTSNVTNMSNMFYFCSSLTKLDLSNFNTSNVTNMSNMFYGCSELTELDLSNFNTSNVTNMSNMFYFCSSLTKLDLSNFNTSNTTNMNSMFNGCSKLTELDIRNFTFDKVTTKINTFNKVPADCEIIVKSDTEKQWILAVRSDFTNIKTISELGS